MGEWLAARQDGRIRTDYFCCIGAKQGYSFSEQLNSRSRSTESYFSSKSLATAGVKKAEAQVGQQKEAMGVQLRPLSIDSKSNGVTMGSQARPSTQQPRVDIATAAVNYPVLLVAASGKAEQIGALLHQILDELSDLP
ncbi:hypothetical protein NDU88_006989 [Pleurodeles waltl]|uniref:Uncharacterized protein n=1 Tax=Pleurodeles waltl TaxID=8319 RepID=A0AAV7VQT7_PLEWA|nr:hypothetical protein NDU88_006989 [Pleurodeles waltl]